MRHFAYYRQSDGAYLREAVVAASGPPAWWAWLPASLREQFFTRWSHRLARPAFGEVALDVSRFDYPVGDFCWSVLRFGDGEHGKPLLDWPQTRVFVQIDRDTAEVVGWLQSPRPCRSTARRWVVDVTGSAWESVYGVFGRLVWQGSEGRWRYAFVPHEQTPRAIAAAAAELNPFDVLTADRMMEV